MKASEFRNQSKNQSIKELQNSLNETLRDQFKLKLVQGSGELTHPHKIREVRRKIAQIMTFLAEKRRVQS